MPADPFPYLATSQSHLHAFCVKPHVKFESQHSDETILLLIRAHPITFLPWLTWSIIGLVIPIIVNVFLPSFISFREVVFVNLLWYSFIFSYVYISVIMWLFNVGIITDQRVMDIDYLDILHKEVSGTSIEDITDVSGKTTGFIRSFFSYGDVYVQTAGSEQNIDFIGAPRPNEVVSFINGLMRK